MSADISTFLANFTGGGYRPNRYRVVLTFPAGVPKGLEAAQKVGFTCKATSIPSSELGVAQVPYMGRFAKIPGDKEWSDWNVTVMLDVDFIQRDVFETWHDLMLGFKGNKASSGMANPINAFATAKVQALDRYDEIIKTYSVEGIWPTSIGEVSLAYDNNNTVAEMQVTFAINGWSSDATKN